MINIAYGVLTKLGLAFTDWTDKDSMLSNVYHHPRIGQNAKNDDELFGWLSAKIVMPVLEQAGP